MSGSSPLYDTIPEKITTPDVVETRIGKLEFFDGLPTPETAARAFDNLDFLRGARSMAMEVVRCLPGTKAYSQSRRPGSRFIILIPPQERALRSLTTTMPAMVASPGTRRIVGCWRCVRRTAASN
jgi:hypothetical protein